MAGHVLRSGLKSNELRMPFSDGSDDGNEKVLPNNPPGTSLCLRESNGNREVPQKSPRKSRDTGRENADMSQAGTKRSTPFKALLERDKAASSARKAEKEERKGLKKSKSSTSLATLLPLPRAFRSDKSQKDQSSKGKENQTPSSTVVVAEPTPIWAQFASSGQIGSTTKIPLNDVEKESASDVQDQSPSKYYNPYNEPQVHSHEKGRAGKPRPRSEVLGSTPSSASLDDVFSDKPLPKQTKAGPQIRRNETAPEIPLRSRADVQVESDVKRSSSSTAAKRGSRVMAAVAAFNNKSKPLPSEPGTKHDTEKLDPQAIADAFEAMLETRNVPQNTRDKMRALDVSIKADLIKQDKAGSRPGTSGRSSDRESETSSITDRGKTSSDHRRDNDSQPAVADKNESPKKSRPRSLTLTFSKGDLSPSKKHKSGNHKRTKSGETSHPGSPQSSGPFNLRPGSSISLNRQDKVALPSYFIEYLCKVQDPAAVEVGKIHKLQQLLRNEAVSWVDDFVNENGVTELLGLLSRTMVVEWREEHEDNLLHEILLCLKALSTTSSALAELSNVFATLFPSLLAMLFDEEKKGPSEYTTRTIIIVLLSNYLTYSTSSTPASRAASLLSYLQDPAPPEDAQPPGFITSIYHPRPFRRWSKELNNLTKEVFWIFLHQTNIVPFPDHLPASSSSPSSSPSSSIESSLSNGTYRDRHFPREHPPRPAAPYIGGVEWDATTYATAHLDLLNGLIASLPTRDERNTLRQQLKDSGFEKVMGAYLRTCKEKFYGCVHESLSTWIGAAREDGWPWLDVREGPPREELAKSPRKKGGCGGMIKKAVGSEDGPPRLDGLKLGLDLGSVGGSGKGGSGGGAGVGGSEGGDIGGWF